MSKNDDTTVMVTFTVSQERYLELTVTEWIEVAGFNPLDADADFDDLAVKILDRMVEGDQRIQDADTEQVEIDEVEDTTS